VRLCVVKVLHSKGSPLFRELVRKFCVCLLCGQDSECVTGTRTFSFHLAVTQFFTLFLELRERKVTLDEDGERWAPLPPMHDARNSFACAAIGRCVIVAGGSGTITTEVYEEALGRWRRLPCNLPHDGDYACAMGSAL
jgi:hypothetical protein